MRILKGTVSRDFLLQVFSWITFPAPENNIRVISNFFENSWRHSQVKVHHRYQRHRRQILQPVTLVLLTPVANLLSVSTIPAANCHRYQRHRRQICHRYLWQRWQIMGTIPGCPVFAKTGSINSGTGLLKSSQIWALEHLQPSPKWTGIQIQIWT